MQTITKPTDPQLRAYQQADQYLLLPTDTPGAFDVVKQDGAHYTTTATSCTCPDSVHRGRVCKHAHLVRLTLQQERDEQRAAHVARMNRDFPL